MYEQVYPGTEKPANCGCLVNEPRCHVLRRQRIPAVLVRGSLVPLVSSSDIGAPRPARHYNANQGSTAAGFLFTRLGDGETIKRPQCHLHRTFLLRLSCWRFSAVTSCRGRCRDTESVNRPQTFAYGGERCEDTERVNTEQTSDTCLRGMWGHRECEQTSDTSYGGMWGHGECEQTSYTCLRGMWGHGECEHTSDTRLYGTPQICRRP